MAITYCQAGFYYCDFSETNNEAFNLLIPLVLLPNVDPELYIQSKCESYEHQYKY